MNQVDHSPRRIHHLRHRAASPALLCPWWFFRTDHQKGRPAVAQTRSPAPAPANRLLERLPEADRQRFLARTRPTPLEFESVLYEARAAIDYAWFPISGLT